MKKNGYTLIELIATIAILATASTLILVNTVGMKGKQEQEQGNRFERAIEEAACAYVDTIEFSSDRENCIRNGCTVKLRTLLDTEIDLVDPDYKDAKTNCTAEQEQDNIVVNVRFEGTVEKGKEEKVKKCTVNRTETVMCP